MVVRDGGLRLARGVCSRLSIEDVIMVGECASLDNEVLDFGCWARGDDGEYGGVGEGDEDWVVD